MRGESYDLLSQYLGGTMAIFISPLRGLRLTMRPALKSIVEGRVVADTGRHIQFNNGEYITEDAEEIAFITKHKRFGTTIFENKPEKINVVVEKEVEKEVERVEEESTPPESVEPSPVKTFTPPPTLVKTAKPKKKGKVPPKK